MNLYNSGQEGYERLKPLSMNSIETHLKGSAIPGPVPPGRSQPELAACPEGQSLDNIGGYFKLFQYKEGHRFSTDDLLVAWFGTTYAPAVSRVLDLGSGIGSVGMIAAWRLPSAQFVTVEAQEISVALARKSARYNGLESRYEIRLGDFRNSDVFKSGEVFDLVLGSPPYFPLEDGLQAEHEQKVACRFEVRGSVADYCAAAAPRLSQGGVFAFVFPVKPAHQLERVLEAAKASGLQIVRKRDVILKEGEDPLLGLFLLMRTTDVPESFRHQTWSDAPLIIRRRDGSIHPEYSLVKAAIGFPLP